MANGLVKFGRGVSVFLCIAQSVLLVLPLAIYKSHYYWFLLPLCIVAGGGMLWWYKQGCYLRHVWGVWLLHIISLGITAGLVLGLVGTHLTEDRVFGSHVFEMSLSVFPFLLFLLLNVASDSNKRRLVILISFRLALDLFDGIDMLDVTLDKATFHGPLDGVPQEMQIVIAVLVLVVFLLSACELRDQSLDDIDEFAHFSRTKSFYTRAVAHVVINLAFLVLRLLLWFHFKQPAPMFIAKSGLSITVYVTEIVKNRKSYW